MRLNDLERALSSIPPHPAPKVALEQYATPADVAAPLLFEARALGDIEGRRVVDLGAGTGVLAIGAALLGAREVVGVEVDAAALTVARESAKRLGAAVEWVEADVARWRGSADTVVMNPPFGAQTPGADRAFLEAAFATASTVYVMHHAPARAFAEKLARERGFATTHAWKLSFTLRHQFRHQEKASKAIDVVALRLVRDTGSRERLSGDKPSSPP